MLSFQSRIQGVNVWTTVVFVMNGLIFLLIGLQLPSITRQLGDISLGRAIGYGLIISVVLIVTRVLSTLGASAFTRIVSNVITVADAHPGWRNPLVLGWSGMRGVVSLAAALSIPVLINEEQPFPYRDLILFITFIVILVTLVFQGLTLPWLIRKIKPEDRNTQIPEPRQEIIIQKKIAQASLQYLEEKYGGDGLPNEHVNNLHARLKLDLSALSQELEKQNEARETSLTRFQTIYLELLEQQRSLLNRMNRLAEFDEELIRKYLSLIDVEEFKIREKQLQEPDAE
jgi:CPA1 family monovalent cation:H+ antiporter